MELPFTHRPGRRERHLRRRHGNPLFAWPPEEIAPETLLAAQKADHEEMEAFQRDFRQLVQQAMDLPPNAGSDTVLSLKESLERCYEQSFGLPEDYGQAREALAKLIELITKAVQRAAGADPLAQRELEAERTARAIHFRLLQQPLVADLLHPESPIREEELAPSLLCAQPSEVDALLEILDPPQIAALIQQCRALLEQRAAQGVQLPEAQARPTQLEQALAKAPDQSHSPAS